MGGSSYISNTSETEHDELRLSFDSVQTPMNKLSVYNFSLKD